ncbi:hypothetical protein GCM10018954_088470 [Kutzneria kofuensis]
MRITPPRLEPDTDVRFYRAAMTDNPLFDYSPIIDRPRITWPDGRKVAVYVGLNIEHFLSDVPPPASGPAPPTWCRTRSTTAGATTEPGSASGG